MPQYDPYDPDKIHNDGDWRELYGRYISVNQELADTREELSIERRRRLSFESLFSDIEQMLAIQRRKP
jgi:hypothetical protein